MSGYDNVQKWLAERGQLPGAPAAAPPPAPSAGGFGTEPRTYDGDEPPPAPQPAVRASGGGYENAPATRMLATHCAACARPLVDAKSVEIGMGPDCRKRLGFDREVSEEARAQANRIVYAIAAHLHDTAPGAGAAQAERARKLLELGFTALADKVLERVAPIRIEVEGDRLAVRTPYSEQATLLFRGIPNRRWDRERKVNVVPAAERRTLWQALERAYPGMVGIGPKGPFVLGRAA
jgi:hypothetical protein